MVRKLSEKSMYKKKKKKLCQKFDYKSPGLGGRPGPRFLGGSGGKITSSSSSSSSSSSPSSESSSSLLSFE